MKSPICEKLGIEFPLIAFTHCRDVVVEVSKSGGMGVLGAAGFAPKQLEIELAWIDEHIEKNKGHYASQLDENLLGELMKISEPAFAEWNNEEDNIYNDL